MVITLTCHPSKPGLARHYTVKAVDGHRRRIAEIIAKNSLEAITSFRAMIGAAESTRPERADHD